MIHQFTYSAVLMGGHFLKIGEAIFFSVFVGDDDAGGIDGATDES
mgnify:CR=1 FL=1